ncbi:O-antigen ligase family protein [Syntrophomonas curvata]
MSKKKVKKNKPKTEGTQPTVNYFSLLVFILAAALIFYPPFFRGLFFNQDMFIYHSLTALVFLLVCIDKIRRRDYSFLSTPLDWAVLAYALAYLLSIIGAVHPGEAVYGFLKALNYFIVFWIISQAVRSYRDYINILRVLFASAVGVALIGIMAATGCSKYPAAFEPATGVILSTLQYPNTTAVYLAIASLLGVTLWIVERRLYLRPLYSLANFLMILVVLATMSKGAWLIFILGAVLLLLGMPGKYRLSSVYGLMLAMAAAAVTASKFLPAIKSAPTAGALKMLMIGVLIILAGELFWQMMLRIYRRWGRRTIPVIITLFLLLAGLAAYQQAGKVQQITEELKVSSLAAEFTGLKDVKGTSYTSRIDFYRWAGQIGRDHFLTGAGAGGWNALYHQYQEYLTWTTETHSHFLQVWVETGIVGLAAFISIWLLLLYMAFRRWRKLRSSSEDELNTETEHWALNWGVLTAALAFGAHAAIDFDLSLGSMAILLWTLFALIDSAARNDKLYTVKTMQQPWILLSIGIVVAVVLLVSGQRMLMANNIFVAGDARMIQAASLAEGAEKAKKLENLAAQTEQACKLDPFNARCYALYAQACALQYNGLIARNDPNAASYRDKGREAIKRAEKLAPYDIKLRGSMVNSCILLQDYDGMVRQAHYLVEANPNDITSYETAIKVSLAAAELSRNSGQPEKEKDYLKEAVSQYNSLIEQSERADQNKITMGYWQGALLIPSSDSRLNTAKAHYLLGAYQPAREVLEPVMNGTAGPPPTDPGAGSWYAAILYKTGEEARALTIVEPIKQSNPDLFALYQNLITLQPLR